MASAGGSKQQPDEFIIRVPKANKSKKFSILKFNGNLNVDVTQWSNVTMAREDNASVFNVNEQLPTSGVGSEFGKQARDEARRKKMGFGSKKYKRDEQPWLLSANASSATAKTQKKFRGIREGGVTQNADFWVFVKAGEGLFDAFPVEQWYNFMPLARYKTLDAEEAEEQFSKRNKILNQFALKMHLKLHEKDGDEEEVAGKTSGKTKDDDNNAMKSKKRNDSDDDVGPTKTVKPTKKKKATKKKAKKRSSDAEDDDLVASADSDDGDDEGREVDYMSDSDESQNSENEPEDTKVSRALRGVDEEEGIKKLMESEDEEDEQNEVEGEKKKVDISKMESMPTSSEFGGTLENDTDSGSDSDDPDKEDIKSALFLQEKKSPDEGSEKPSASTPANSTIEQSSNSSNSTTQKRKHEDNSSGVPAKKSKGDRSKAHESAGGITEEEVRRYLQRKPLSAADLVTKFKPRCKGMGKQEIVKCLADILKRLKPEHFRRKDTLYYSLKK